MKRNDLITPEGTKDLLFDECQARRLIERKLNHVYQSRGYCEVVTPAVEFYDVFNSGTRHYAQEILYKLVDQKGRLMVLRPDSTLPIARLVATRLKNAVLPLRLYYNQDIHTINPSMSGRRDEVMQTGLELIGCNSERADLEVLATAIEALSVCDTGDFRLEIGDIGVFRTLSKKLCVDEDTVEEIRTLIERKNYPALNDLLDKIGHNEVTDALKQLPRLFGGEEVLDRCSALFDDPQIQEVLKRLRRTYRQLSMLGHDGKIVIDLGIVNRNDYYTGVVFCGYVQGFGEQVLSGGRYDALISGFGVDMPAIGFGVNVDAVANVLLREKQGSLSKAPDVLVYAQDGYEMKGLLHANRLIESGLCVENALSASLDEARSYAQFMHIRRIDVVGGEIESITVGGNADAQS